MLDKDWFFYSTELTVGLILISFLVLAILLLHKFEKSSMADWGGKWRNRLAGMNYHFCRFYHRLDYEELKLPRNGGALVVGNHVSGLDPLLMIAASPRPLRFLIAREEYERWHLNWIFRLAGCIPVEREGDPRAAFYAARRALAGGEVIAMFPQGKICRPGSPVVRLKRGVFILARMTGVPIIPLHINGIRGQGMAAIAVMIPSKAKIKIHPSLSTESNTDAEMEQKLSEIIHQD